MGSPELLRAELGLGPQAPLLGLGAFLGSHLLRSAGWDVPSSDQSPTHMPEAKLLGPSWCRSIS